MSDIVLSAILVSVIDENNIERVKTISQSHGLFGIDLKKIIQDKEKQKIRENTFSPKEENNAHPEEENITPTEEKKPNDHQ